MSTTPDLAREAAANSPHSKGRFGVHGGQCVPETLMSAVNELEEAYDRYKATPTSTPSSPPCSTTTPAVRRACTGPTA